MDMVIVLRFLLIVQVLICLFSVQQVCAQSVVSGLVTKIIDGDSLQVISEGKTIIIRLYGIDCPEYGEKFAQQAKKFVKKRVYKKNITFISEYFDSYGRVVAIVMYDGKNLNKEIVRSGLAWVYPRYCIKEVCKTWKENEKKARKNKKGVWSEQNPIAPWKWKRMHK